ncbi:MAG TPA: helix-turn-helix domain-containing protein [Bacteroidota bacterium]|nr:helix-turn-helix domain-containing protein [Bacteroidota bacterium]
MKSFFDDLRRLREEKHVSLAEIADRTLINIKYLEAIEEGNTAILPEAYVRAFIREYAAAIGMDPADTMRRFDEGRRAAEERVRPHEVIEPPPPRPTFTLEPAAILTPRMATLAAAVVVVAVGAVFLWNLLSPEPSPSTREVPFQSVVKEHEQQLSAASAEPPPPVIRRVDSLTLSAVVSDTLWMSMSIDSLPSREYLFHPGARASWRARTRFTVTLGNAGAVSFLLNQKSLGVAGKRGAVLRNVSFTRQNLNSK